MNFYRIIKGITIYRVIAVSSLVLIEFVSYASAELLTALIVGGLISGIGAGISAWATYSGINKQIAENQRAEAVELKLRDEDIARSEKWASKQYKLSEKAQEFNEKMATEQLGMTKEQNKINNIMNFVGSFRNSLSGNQQMKQNLAQIWRGRRAA